MASSNYCSECGNPVSPQARFCPTCGAIIQPVPAAGPPVQPVPATQFIPPPPENQAPYPAMQPYVPPRAETPARIPTWVWGAAAGAGCVFVLAVGVVAAVLLLGLGRTAVVTAPTAVPTLAAAATSTPLSIINAAPTAVPTQAPLPQPTLALALTGRQENSPYHIIDDFSSKALGWVEDQNDVGRAAYQDGAYVMAVTAPDNGVFVRVPVKMDPNHIEFKARVINGPGGGLYAVRCLAQDENAYYEVWLDPNQTSYRLLQFSGGSPAVVIDWSQAQGFASPGEMDTVMVECLPGMISLWLNNNSLFDQVIAAQNGKMYLVVKTYREMTPPFEVQFDDVDAWKQMQ